MKFKYYIVDTRNGDIWGTDDDVVAENSSMSDENYVIDVESNEWVQMDTVGERFKIPRKKG